MTGVSRREITFRALTEDDLPLMQRWLAADHVAEWYPVEDVRKPPLELVRSHYLPRIRGEDPTRAYLTLLGGRPVGYIQACLIDDYPEYASAVQLPPGTAGIDMFIGEVDAVHRGLGSPIIGRFLDEVVFGEMGAARACLGPEPDNRVAIRAYEKAGFRHLKTVEIPGGDPEHEYLMVLERPSDATSGGG